EKIKRLMSVTGNPQFKGDGFYQTDYKKVKS
ncbi:zinc ribbon domain-containing protein, partial [bacterium]|nr:zinc ribbon domain-containing protein [bacterium]